MADGPSGWQNTKSPRIFRSIPAARPRTSRYGALSLFDAACVQAPSERGAGRDADVRGSPRLPNSPSHRALHRPRIKEVAREAINHQKGSRVSGALSRGCRGVAEVDDYLRAVDEPERRTLEA